MDRRQTRSHKLQAKNERDSSGIYRSSDKAFTGVVPGAVAGSAPLSVSSTPLLVSLHKPHLPERTPAVTRSQLKSAKRVAESSDTFTEKVSTAPEKPSIVTASVSVTANAHGQKK
eukprot:Lankesteria_metandrocarpae@DN4353_c0_g1_i2.p2